MNKEEEEILLTERGCCRATAPFFGADDSDALGRAAFLFVYYKTLLNLRNKLSIFVEKLY